MNDQISFIKNNLRVGEIKQIAEERKVNLRTAYAWLSGRNKKITVGLAAFLKVCHERASQNASEFIAMREQEEILNQKINAL